ncbi:putative Ulp1 protease family catalytic domain, papain-like cysteine peptidase superfamily [Septoria linicola]|nr:putative Ulp1 protease family catalytic domain, papain-like cysteine peptidase superfamily [Septoria linicola]
MDERERALIAELRDCSVPARRVERFLDLCRLHSSNHDNWDGEDDNNDGGGGDDGDRWAALDGALTAGVLKAIDDDIEAALFQHVAGKQKTRAALPTPADSTSTTAIGGGSGGRPPDEVSRLRGLQRMEPWKLRPHQLVRDLGQDALKSHILRQLQQITKCLRDRHGQPISWPRLARAAHRAARARRDGATSRGRNVNNRAPDLQISDLVRAESQLIAAGCFKHTAQANMTRKRRGTSLAEHDNDDDDDDDDNDGHEDGDANHDDQAAEATPRKKQRVDDAPDGDTELLSPEAYLDETASLVDDDALLDASAMSNGIDHDGAAQQLCQQDVDDSFSFVRRRDQSKEAYRRQPKSDLPLIAVARTPIRAYGGRYSEPHSRISHKSDSPTVEVARRHTNLDTPQRPSFLQAVDSYSPGSSPLPEWSDNASMAIKEVADPPEDFVLEAEHHNTPMPAPSTANVATPSPLDTERLNSPSRHSPNVSQHIKVYSGAAHRSSKRVDLARIAVGNTGIPKPFSDLKSAQPASMEQVQPTPKVIGSLELQDPVSRLASAPVPLRENELAPSSPANNQVSSMTLQDTAPSALIFVTPDDVSNCLRVASSPTLVPTDTAGQLATLQPGKWLSASTLASVISAFNPDPAVHRLMESPYLELSPSGNATNELRARRDKGRSHSQFYVLINIARVHWCVAMLDRTASQLELYDPTFGGTTQFARAYSTATDVVLEYAARIGQHSGNTPANWTSKPHHLLRQRNSHDCGIYVAVRTIYQMHGRECPAAIIPEIWRRAFALFLSSDDSIAGDENADDSAFSPSWVLERLLKAFDLPLRGELAPSSGAVVTYRKISQLFTLLHQETSSIAGLSTAFSDIDDPMSPQEIKTALAWQQKMKDACPQGVNLAYQERELAAIDLKISRLRTALKQSTFQEILAKDAAEYRQHAKEWEARADKMLDVVEMNVMKEMDVVRSLRLARER